MGWAGIVALCQTRCSDLVQSPSSQPGQKLRIPGVLIGDVDGGGVYLFSEPVFVHIFDPAREPDCVNQADSPYGASVVQGESGSALLESCHMLLGGCNQGHIVSIQESVDTRTWKATSYRS